MSSHLPSRRRTAHTPAVPARVRWAGRGRAVGHALALGAISFVFSEPVFWAHWREDDTALGLTVTWLVYCIVSYLAFAVARRLGVWSTAGLFLVGAFFGWLVEGAIAGTVFISPDGPVWTGLAWHAPLTVLFGWHLLPAVLRRRNRARSVLTSVCLGTGFGLWSAGFVHDPELDRVPSLAAYALFAAGICAVLVGAYPLRDRLMPAVDTPLSRGALISAAVFIATWFVLGIVVAIPWAAVVLPALLWLPVWALRSGGQRPGGAHLLAVPACPLSVRDCAPLFAMAPAAVVTFALLEPVSGFVPVMAVYLVIVPTSAVWFVMCLRRVRRARPTGTPGGGRDAVHPAR